MIQLFKDFRFSFFNVLDADGRVIGIQNAPSFCIGLGKNHFIAW